MHQEMRRDPQPAHLEGLAGIPLDELHLGGHVAQPDRKVGRVGLVGERRLQRLRGTRRPDDREVRSGDKRRQEEGKPLDVVEVRVSDQEMRLDWFARAEAAAQLRDPGAGIDHQQVVFLVSHFDAGRVAAVAKGPPARSRTRPPCAPELDPH